MIKIAHRGNYAGKNPSRENTISYIEEAISAGYDVEIDVRLIHGDWFLGHDSLQEKIDISFFERPKVWTHCKNIEGYLSVYNNPKAHVFWHDKDEFVYTSKGIKWANVGVITHDGIMVMPEYDQLARTKIKNKSLFPLGICSDNFNLFEV